MATSSRCTTRGRWQTERPETLIIRSYWHRPYPSAPRVSSTLYKDGSKFDSSRDRDAPFDLTLGQGMVIKGWDEGLFGSCAGEKRKLIIPSGKGYGASGSGAK